MAEKKKKKTTTRRRRSSSGKFKMKKGRDIVKGVLSVGINTLLQNFIQKIELKDKDGKVDPKKTAQTKGALYGGIFLMGGGSLFPKTHVSGEYIEINALENAIQEFVSLSKNKTVKNIAPFLQAAGMIERADNEDVEYFQGVDSDDYFEGMIETSENVSEEYDF